MRAPRPSRLRAYLAVLQGFLRRNRDHEPGDEIEQHLDLLAERFVANGMPPEEAAQRARRQFGNLTLLEEDRRALQIFPGFEALWRDFRYALRSLSRNLGFSLIAVCTLGLGIGAAAAIFSVIDNVLLEPFPYANSGRMVFPRIHDVQQDQAAGRQGYTAAEYLAFAEDNHVFESITAATEDPVLYQHGQATEQLDGAHVAPGTFEFFAMPALYGRVLVPGDYRPGAAPVFVLRYKTWIERFDGDPAALNRTFRLNGVSRTLVGIMPPRFAWFGADLWMPENPEPQAGAGFAESREIWFLLGRLKPQVTMQQAEADLTVIASGIAKVHPNDYPPHFAVQVRKLGDTVVGRFEATLYTVLAAVGLLLLIACSNVANLMLARATTRGKEFALRASLGAGRARLVRLLMVESLSIAVAAALLGVFIAWAGLKALVAAMPQDLIPAESVIALNLPVLGFTLGVAVLTALLFGLFPALESSPHEPNDPLRESGKGVDGKFAGRWLRDAVVVLEVALSLTLLMGAGLLMRGFVALREVPLGLRADHVFQAALPLPVERYKSPEQVNGFFRSVLPRLKALPGVVDAATASSLPPYSDEVNAIEIVGLAHQEPWHALLQQVSHEYFEALRIAFEQGRPFTEAEVNGARRLAVVNETFARRYLHGRQPLGIRVRFESSAGAAQDPPCEIVGVVADVKNNGPQAPVEPEVWIPYTLHAGAAHFLIVRTRQNPDTLMNAVRREVWTIDSGVALADPSSLENRINERLYAGPRFGFLLMTVFGCIGLVLVTVGVYSVLAYAASQKTHEIGIRMALGADRGDVVGMVVRAGLRLLLVGLSIGVVTSLLLAQLIGGQLAGVKTYDPATLASTTLLLALTASIACWIPARRAARVDPMIALRYE